MFICLQPCTLKSHDNSLLNIWCTSCHWSFSDDSLTSDCRSMMTRSRDSTCMVTCIVQTPVVISIWRSLRIPSSGYSRSGQPQISHIYWPTFFMDIDSFKLFPNTIVCSVSVNIWQMVKMRKYWSKHNQFQKAFPNTSFVLYTNSSKNVLKSKTAIHDLGAILSAYM